MIDAIIDNPAGYVPSAALAFGLPGEAPSPVSSSSPLPVTAQSLIERLNREGDPVGTSAASTYSAYPAPTGAGTSGPFALAAPAPGRACFIQQVHYWSTTPIQGRCQIGASNWNTGVGTPVQMDIGFACSPTLSARFAVNAFVRSSDKAAMGMYVSRWLDPAVAGTHYVGCGATAWTLADSINFEAKKVILVIGDSLWNGTGPSSVQTCIPWLVNKFYRDAGVDSRYILKAYSGSTTSGHETFRQGGRYDFPRLDAIFYALGMNDAGQGYTTATSMANVAALVAWKQKRYPAARLVLCGPPPVQASAMETALQALRAAMSAYVAGLGDPTVLFCDFGNSFDRAAYANYASSDANGSALHPGDAGLTQQWNGGYNGNGGLKSWLAANLPKI